MKSLDPLDKPISVLSLTGREFDCICRHCNWRTDLTIRNLVNIARRNEFQKIKGFGAISSHKLYSQLVTFLVDELKNIDRQSLEDLRDRNATQIAGSLVIMHRGTLPSIAEDAYALADQLLFQRSKK